MPAKLDHSCTVYNTDVVFLCSCMPAKLKRSCLHGPAVSGCHIQCVLIMSLGLEGHQHRLGLKMPLGQTHPLPHTLGASFAVSA